MATDQPCYTLIASPSDTSEIPNEQELKKQLCEGDVKQKTVALKRIIQLMLNGERFPGLLMPIIQYVMPSQDHTLKKLLLIFWEIVPKTTPDGKLLHEMILVCDAYRKDLQHPNEFIRGSTLRFLCKLKEPELLEPLMPAIRGCLENRHAYVRRNAVLAIFTIYKIFDQLIPDAPELVQTYLEGESDPSCKRNAFMMLMHVDQDRALDYLSSCIDMVNTFNEILQLVIVELVYKVCYDNPTQRSRFIRCVYNMLNSTSSAVRYDAAGVLVTLSSAPTAVKAAAQCYIELIVKESDNNIKLIVFDRLFALKDNPAHEKILQDLVMDMLRVLSSTDLEVRKKALKLVSELVTSRTVDEVIMIIKKELANTESAGESDTVDISGYRQLLVQTLHQCSIKFPSVAPMVVPVLTDFLSDKDKAAAFDILTFTRDAAQRYPTLQSLVVGKLLEVFAIIQVPEVHRGALWILGEYASSVEDISRVIQVIRKAIGEIPIVDSELRKAAGENPEEKDLDQPTTTHTVRVTADGTYASESALVPTVVKKDEDIPPIRRYLLDGKFFIGAAVSSTLTKLALRYIQLTGNDQSKNMFCAEVMLMIASILHLGRSGLPKEPITQDDYERMSLCMRSLAERQPLMTKAFAHGSREALIAMLKTTGAGVAKEEKKSKSFQVQADDLINFRQLSVGMDSQGENKIEASLLQATGNVPQIKEDVSESKLSKVIQLTGFSDPVYAEAYVIVNQYDIMLDVLVVNQTSDTLQGLTLELATLGDLRLVDKPVPTVLAANGFENIKATIKISSTENGIIFGNIVYDIVGAASDRNCVVLNNIHIDIMDYINPASCTDEEFRKMWVEFEWENKITVNTNITDLNEYLQHIMKSTNMQCLTPEETLTGDCGFLAANLYARSIFGEDALANVSIEKLPGSDLKTPVQGHIRIRAKSQGMALSLGDKINVSQKLEAKS